MKYVEVGKLPRAAGSVVGNGWWGTTARFIEFGRVECLIDKDGILFLIGLPTDEHSPNFTKGTSKYYQMMKLNLINYRSRISAEIVIDNPYL